MKNSIEENSNIWDLSMAKKAIHKKTIMDKKEI